MNLLSTIIVGLIAGWLVSLIMKTKGGLLMNLILGVIGGIVGGWITSLLLGVDLVGGFNLTSILVATVGAIIVVAVYRFFKH